MDEIGVTGAMAESDIKTAMTVDIDHGPTNASEKQEVHPESRTEIGEGKKSVIAGTGEAIHRDEIEMNEGTKMMREDLGGIDQETMIQGGVGVENAIDIVRGEVRNSLRPATWSFTHLTYIPTHR